MKPSLIRCARLALATSALVLALPFAQSDARPFNSYQTSRTDGLTTFKGEATDFTARRKKQVRHVRPRQQTVSARRHHRRASAPRLGQVAVAPTAYDSSAVFLGTGFATTGAAAHVAAPQRTARSRRAVARQTVSSRQVMRSRQVTAPQSVVTGSSSVVAEARRYLGGNPTGMSRAWCAAFMNMVLKRSGHAGTGSNLARSFASYGRRVSGPQVGAIAVMSRRGGGHVGVVSGVDAKGNPIVISGNYNRRVAEAVYPRGRIYAYVMPH